MTGPLVDHTDTAAQEEPTLGEPTVPALVCEADIVQLDLPADQDPFGACLQVAGLHPSGTELVVWLRLTPTTIDRLVGQLQQVLHDQQTALGVPSDIPAQTNVDVDVEPDLAGPGESRVRRFLDPLGLRHVRARSPRSTIVLAAAIAALMLLAFLVSVVRG